jgi:hypothetical protein
MVKEITKGTTADEHNFKSIFVEDFSIQDVPGGKANILGGHSISNSKKKTSYKHVSYSERFPR